MTTASTPPPSASSTETPSPGSTETPSASSAETQSPGSTGTPTPPDRLAADSGTTRLGTFSYLPPLSEEEVRRQLDRLLAADLDPAIEHTAPERVRDRYWRMWRLPFFGDRSVDAVLAEVDACWSANPGHVIQIVGYDRHRQTRATAFAVDRTGTGPRSAPPSGPRSAP